MRIAFLSRRYWPAVSGMTVYAENLLRQLRAGGHDVTMISEYRGDEVGQAIYGGGPPPAMDGIEIVGARSHGEELAPLGEAADFERDIAELVRLTLAAHADRSLDVIHAQYCYPTGYAALIAARRLGLPCIVSIQGGDGHWVGLCCETHRLAMADVLTGAGTLLIGSDSFADEVAGHHGIPRERFTVVGGATDATRFTPRTGERPPGPARLLYHGRVDLRKGLGELIEAADALARKGADFDLTISGIGPDLDEAKARVAALPALAPRTRFTGYTAYDDAPDVYRAADIFVSPTYTEGFSNTILEAMATGLAIVSTETIGVVDCLRDGENGLLVPVADVPVLEAAMQRLLDDPALAARLAATALEEVDRLYSWPVLAEKILRAYRETPPATGEPTPLPAYADADTSCRFRRDPHLL